jgi:hypothetical protein
MRNAKTCLVGTLLTLVLLACTGPAQAAVDPDLIVLDAKVNALGALLNVVLVKIEFHNAQHEEMEPVMEGALLGLEDARRRSVEAFLLRCAVDPGPCVTPGLLISALDEECQDFDDYAPSPNDEDPCQHDPGYRCPLRELILIVQADLEAAQAQGLVRDYATASTHLESAIAAAEVGEGRPAFEAACSAFKLLACP